MSIEEKFKMHPKIWYESMKNLSAGSDRLKKFAKGVVDKFGARGLDFIYLY